MATKRVLILSGSPRLHGNSDVLCDQFAKGALESGHQVEKVRLASKKIQYCLGCGICNETHVCVQNDDMSHILQQMIEADVLVFSTPVYFYCMNAQMKTLIDRTVPRYTEIKHKDVYYIMTAADEDPSCMTKTIEAFRGFVDDCLDDVKEAGILYGTGAWKIGEIQHTTAYQQAYEMGKKI